MLKPNKQTNKQEIQISSAVLSLGGNEFKAKDISYDEKHETATLAFESALPTGTCLLAFLFFVGPAQCPKTNTHIAFFVTYR